MSEQAMFKAFYERNIDLVYAVAMSYLHNAADAEDAAADVFAQVLEQNISFENQQHERAWLVTAVKNRCKNRLTHWSNKRRDDEIPEQPTSDNAVVELRETMSAIGMLPDKYRLPLVLCAIQGYSVSETANILKINESTVTTRINRARTKLSHLLEGGVQT